jgi:hypothetical protein
MKTAAATSGWPTRERALLIAEAIPEFRTGTELISPVVSGATSSEIPMPKMIDAGSGPTSASIGGTSEPGLPRVAAHGAEVEPTVSHHSDPAAITSGPTTRNGRTPRRPDSAPTRVDSSVSKIPVGSPTIAAPSGV